MRVIIAGSRSLKRSCHTLVAKAVLKAVTGYGIDIDEVVCGECYSIDEAGKVWAKSMGVPVKSFPANWDKYGKRAGFIRNGDMAKYASEQNDGALLGLWDGISPGSRHMIEAALQYGLSVIVWIISSGLTLPTPAVVSLRQKTEPSYEAQGSGKDGSVIHSGSS